MRKQAKPAVPVKGQRCLIKRNIKGIYIEFGDGLQVPFTRDSISRIEQETEYGRKLIVEANGLSRSHVGRIANIIKSKTKRMVDVKKLPAKRIGNSKVGLRKYAIEVYGG